MRVFSVEETLDLAERLATIVQKGDCITLQGDLGAGKTTFVQQLITSLSAGSEIGVTSPTFNLLQTYDVVLESGALATIWHYDLYRLDDEAEAEELAIDEAIETGIPVIEWPELILHRLPQDRIAIVIDFGEAVSGRNIEFSSSGDAQRRLQEAGLC